jgi:hypothetical protein
MPTASLPRNHLGQDVDTGPNVIPDSIKLAAGRTGREYNARKNGKGAFGEDRYHAIAEETNRYFCASPKAMHDL